MFKKVDPKQNFPRLEEEILKFWEANKIFEKSVERNASHKSFIFYEGPPTANGTPGLHHVLARAFKDVIPRYKTMKGYRVERKAGWDTHGLPVEIQVEKELGIRSKPEIENIVPGNVKESITEFNKKCKESVWKYKDEWEKMTKRMGYWIDLDHPYITYENEYIESVWWVIAQIAKLKTEKGEPVLYQGHKVVPYCYRCGTALSSHEVAQGYQKVKDNSVYVKFKLKAEEKTYFLAWTTTPWTLPGNVALALNPNLKYVKVEKEGEFLILAQEMTRVIDEEFKNVEEFEGKKLLGLEYEPLFSTNNSDKKAYYVIAGEFITTQEGTGIVHIAPAFGEDDARVGQKNNLPTLLTVDLEGKMKGMNIPGEGVIVKKKDDKNNYIVDNLIIEDLKNRNLLFKEELFEHDYPYCWRCDTPLIYYAKPSWFVRMSAFQKELVVNNQKINWIPEYIKEGRFGEWLAEAKDWAISRDRYWGTPLPIWKCQKCGKIKVVESQKELEEMSGEKLDDLHKPFIDEVKLKCDCGGEMLREPEVMDVWFDSGSMPTAQFHYPNNSSEEIKNKIASGKYYPADFISEAVDQTRGWFYTLHAISTLLNQGRNVPSGCAYKNVICLGHILDAQGKKMSKSRGNIIDPLKVMDEHGADILRWMLYTLNQPGLPKRFDIKKIKEVMNRVFRMLWNSYYFFVMYANIDSFQSSKILNLKFIILNLLDKWIISELNILIKNIDEKLNNYDVYNAAGLIEKFIDNLSNWYIRRSRRRFWKSESDDDKKQAYETLYYVLLNLSKLMAPFTPFMTEEIYKNLTGNESVHLADFPKADKNLIDEKLNAEMNQARNIVSQGLQLRAKAGIKVRQPLSALRIKDSDLRKELLEIIKEEVNVKNVTVDKNIQNVELDTKITEELKQEGQAREIIRHIQEMRKEASYEVDNRIKVVYNGMFQVFEKYGDLIRREVLAEDLDKGKMEEADLEREFRIKNESIKISIKKV